MTPPRQRGQATVELVLCLPVIVLALLLVIQIGLVARAHVLVVDAARQGARAAAVSGPDAAAPAARSTPGLDPSRMDVQVSTEPAPGVDGEVVRVHVRYRAATDVPLAGALLGDPTLTAEVAMLREDPG
ncbi:TadE family protein [Aquihabitans sp. McL0605]|uniref:TadE family protein n=1 Tax=Aquihabitans sp. McL0605 TaxID=3415671 RepID=UPI003CE6BE1F